MTFDTSVSSLDVNEEEYEKAHVESSSKVFNEWETCAVKKRLGTPDTIPFRKKGFFEFETNIRWSNSIMLIVLHIGFVYYFITYPWRTKWATFALAYFIGFLGGIGVAAGAHRYWTHKSYKANIPFRIILLTLYCIAGQNSIKDWVRDHRVHHKFSETDADPHNSKRGFFFAHMGWLMLKKHPEVIRKGREIDINDLLEDPVVVFAQKYFIALKILLAFIIPTVLPVLILKESWYISLVTRFFLIYPMSLNYTWTVNSLAHIYGNRPYDKKISPTENKFVSLICYGEGWHNYHHAFPSDYKAAEFGPSPVNLTTGFIDLFAKIGWVWDRKQPSSELIRAVVNNRGDGSHQFHHR